MQQGGVTKSQRRQERIRKREAKTGLPCFVLVIVVGDRQCEVDVDEKRTWKWVLGKIQTKHNADARSSVSVVGLALP